MKREINVPGNKLIILYRIIVAVMLLLAALLIAGSLYGLLRSRDSAPLFRIGGGGQGGGGAVRDGGVRGGVVRDDGAVKDNVYSIFSGIGMLRIQNTGKSQDGQQPAASEPAVIIISISFPYNPEDRLFTEELASNIGKFRSIAVNYFSNLPRDSLAGLDEDKAKADIIKQYNALLRLGRIETLYFGDLMVME
jgi:flagellar basal body-associated protein FliL